MLRLPFLLLLAASFTADAVVIRHDVDDANYRIPDKEFPALVDMPGEAHGVLIAPQWIVTAAHTTFGNPREVMLNGVSRRIERVIIHPNYKALPNDLIAQAVKSGDASQAMAFQTANDDIALIKLAAPVTDVNPVPLYLGRREAGKTAKLIGKGATGNGNSGQTGGNRTVLRRAYSKIASTSGHWLVTRFATGPAALALEGMSGSGDSGGPVLIERNGQWQLAGLAAWKYVDGHAAAFRTGLYGQATYNVRISSYLEWMRSMMSSDARATSQQGPNNLLKPTPLRGAA